MRTENLFSWIILGGISLDIKNISACYINLNTLQATSNIANTVYKGDKTQIPWTMEVEKLDIDWNKELYGRSTELKLAAKTSVDRSQNSIIFGKGASVTLSKGFTITLGSKCFEWNGDLENNPDGYEQATAYCGALTELIRYANGQVNNLYLGMNAQESAKKSQDTLAALRAFGIDTSKGFNVNGMAFSVDANGVVRKKEELDAKVAYERQSANNKTYEFADEKTKNLINHLCNYYLSNVPDNVKQAWQETLEETGINPFSSGSMSTLSQLAMEQDFATGGNDDIFGDSLESVETAINIIAVLPGIKLLILNILVMMEAMQ